MADGSRHDLLMASNTFTKPIFSCSWHTSITKDLFWPHGFLQPPNPMIAGRAFRSCSLPMALVAVLEDLSTVDFALEQCRLHKVDDGDYCKLMEARDAVQHRLLSLPSWTDLDEEARSGTSCPVYEGTRLTGLLYSNAIIYPHPPHNEWHIRLVDRLKMSLEKSLDEDWSTSPSTLLTWILVIINIAAFRTRDEEFFQPTLKHHIAHRTELRSKAAVREAVTGYLWSDIACGKGFSVVWESLQELDRTKRCSLKS